DIVPAKEELRQVRSELTIRCGGIQFANFFEDAQSWIEVLQLLIVITDVDGFIPLQFSTDRSTRADESSQQCRLSRAVGAENGPSLVALDLEVDAVHQWYVFVADRKIVCR